jgi:hypothetical protein
MQPGSLGPSPNGGPPKTDSAPMTQNTRFYRLILQP